MTFDNDFKKAIEMLPSKEKDKLILRLLRSNKKTAEKLRFELVDTDSAEDKRDQLKEEIIKQIKHFSKNFYSTGYLLMDMRDLSGRINEHVRITKDKEGEISLNCLMIRQVLEQNNQYISEATRSKSYTLCIYIVARIFKIMLLIQKQHEDLHLEFQEDIEAIGQLIPKNDNLMKMSIQNGLDVNWLCQFNIPENIAQIHKDLKSRGLLK